MSYETSVPPVGVDPQVKNLADSYAARGQMDSLLALRCEQAERAVEELTNGDPTRARRIAWSHAYVSLIIQHIEETDRLLKRLENVTRGIEEQVDRIPAADNTGDES